MDVSDVRRLKSVDAENARQKCLLAEAMLEDEVTKEALRKKIVTALDCRILVRWMQTTELSQRRSLSVARLRSSVLRYQIRPDRNTEFGMSIVELARRHRCYGVGVIYLKLRQRR